MAKDVTASELLLEFKDVKLWMGLEVASLKIMAPCAAMSLRPFTFELPNKGLMEAVVEEAGIKALLEAQAPAQLRNLHVSAHEGKLFVTGIAKLGFKIPIEAVAELYIEEECRLLVRLLSTGNLPGPVHDLLAKQVEKANPLLEASDWPVRVSFTSVACGEGKVVLRGLALGF